MNLRDLRIFLVLEVAGFAVAGLVFSIFDNRIAAGAIAGSYFVASGLYMAARIWRWPAKWRSLTLYPLFIHVFVISIPMMFTRMNDTQIDFSEVTIWGIQGPEFHRLSSTVFTVLVVATVIDLIRSIRKRSLVP